MQHRDPSTLFPVRQISMLSEYSCKCNQNGNESREDYDSYLALNDINNSNRTNKVIEAHCIKIASYGREF